MGEEKRSFYTGYVSERRETNASEHCYELVKKLLEKLPESERTIIVLYYLGRMTTEEIGKSLGVSVNTITSRLQRGHKLLQKDEILLIQEVLGGAQISESVIENIMRQIADIKPTSLSVRKRFLFIFSTILVIAVIVAFVLKLLNGN